MPKFWLRDYDPDGDLYCGGSGGRLPHRRAHAGRARRFDLGFEHDGNELDEASARCKLKPSWRRPAIEVVRVKITAAGRTALEGQA